MNPATHPAEERHYTVAEVSKMWGLSAKTVNRIFSNVDGVVRFNGSRKASVQKYITLRIPASTMRRVHETLTSQDPALFRRKTTGAAAGRKSSVAAAASRSL